MRLEDEGSGGARGVKPLNLGLFCSCRINLASLTNTRILVERQLVESSLDSAKESRYVGRK